MGLCAPHPLKSELLDKLELGEPVVVSWSALPRSSVALGRRADVPDWCRAGPHVVPKI